MKDKIQLKRWHDFRRRADYAPEDVYRHRTHGWEYIPVHPFGDEPELLNRLLLRPEDCRAVDAWWAVDGDATFLQVEITNACQSIEAFARLTSSNDKWMHLSVGLNAKFITREAFEDLMSRFARAGFPSDIKFNLKADEPALRIDLGNGFW